MTNMSHSSPAIGPYRRFRTSSTASHSSPRLIPGSPDSPDGVSNTTSDVNYGSFRGHSEAQTLAMNPSNASGPREPTRSFVHLSYRGSLGMQPEEISIFQVLTILYSTCRQCPVCSKCTRRLSGAGFLC